MGPTERGIPSLLDQMRTHGFDGKAGRFLPIEAVYEMNVVTHDQFLAIRDEMANEERARRNGEAISEMESEVIDLQDRMRRAGAPPRYVGCYIDSTNVGALGNGQWMYVYGPDQDAVNQRACAAMKGWLRANRYGMASYERSNSMLAAIRDDETGTMARLSCVGLLVVANIGSEPPTEWAMSKMADLLDRRMTGGKPPSYGMPTIVTSGLGPNELAAHFASRGSDHMARALMKMIQRQAVLVSA